MNLQSNAIDTRLSARDGLLLGHMKRSHAIILIETGEEWDMAVKEAAAACAVRIQATKRLLHATRRYLQGRLQYFKATKSSFQLAKHLPSQLEKITISGSLSTPRKLKVFATNKSLKSQNSQENVDTNTVEQITELDGQQTY